MVCHSGGRISEATAFLASRLSEDPCIPFNWLDDASPRTEFCSKSVAEILGGVFAEATNRVSKVSSEYTFRQKDSHDMIDHCQAASQAQSTKSRQGIENRHSKSKSRENLVLSWTRRCCFPLASLCGKASMPKETYLMFFRPATTEMRGAIARTSIQPHCSSLRPYL